MSGTGLWHRCNATSKREATAAQRTADSHVPLSLKETHSTARCTHTDPHVTEQPLEESRIKATKAGHSEAAQ